MAIDGIEDEFVAEAVRRFIRGEVKRERHAFMPTAAELAIEARRAKNEAMASRHAALPKPQQVERVLSDAERQEVDRQFAALMDKLGSSAGLPVAKAYSSYQDYKAETEEILKQECLAAFPSEITVSAEALQRLGIAEPSNADGHHKS
jgi:hypothetical protein